jgi:hypothetical protein
MTNSSWSGLSPFPAAYASRRLQALSVNQSMIAGCSRALAEDLRQSMSGAEFGAALQKSIDESYGASTVKI